jgi:PAS domain S-box-containing protein
VAVPGPILVFVLANALAAAVTFALAVYVVFRGVDDRSLQLFGVLLVALVLWSAAETAALLTGSLGGKLIWQFVGTIGVAATPPTLLLFTLSYTGRGQHVSVPTAALLAVEPVVTLGLLFTNGAHGLYYTGVEVISVQGAPVLSTTGGPAFWLHTAYSYVLIAVALLLLVRFALTAEGLYRFQVVTLVSGSLFPLAANLAFLAGVFDTTLDVTPPTFALSSLLIFAGVARGRFTHFLPVDRETLLSAVDDGILVTDGEGRVIYVNDAAREMLAPGARNERFVGEPLSTVLPVAASDAVETVRTADGATAFEASTWRGGESRWFWVRQVDLGGAGIESRLITVTDISERKSRQWRSEQLQEATWELLDVSDPAEVAAVAVATAEEVFTLPFSGVFLADEATDELEGVAVTDAVRDAFGEAPDYPRDESEGIGRVAWEVFEQAESMVVRDAAAAPVLDPGTAPVRSVVVYPLPGHGVFVLSAGEADAFDENDLALIEILCSTVKGALDQVESRRELRANERRLKRQNERLEEFTGVVSHDLRSPLNTARGSLDLLSAEQDGPNVERIDRAIARMETLVEDLLTLARQGKTVDRRTEVSLATLARRAWETVPTPGASLSVEEGLGRAAVDESRLEEAFENLFRNAVDHAGPQTTVRVGPLATDAGFYVADNGPGIPADQRERVFDHGYTTSDEGTGLGLAIIKRIIEAHGWELDVTTSTDGGARFEVTGVERPEAVTGTNAVPED